MTRTAEAFGDHCVTVSRASRVAGMHACRI